MILTATFAGAIAPPAPHAPHSLYGYLELDIDQDPASGVDHRFGQATTRPGIDYLVDLFDALDLQAEILDTRTFLPVGTAALSFRDSTLGIDLPLSLLGMDDGRFDWGLSVGTLAEENDRSLGTAVPEPAGFWLGAIVLPTLGFAAFLQRRSPRFRTGRAPWMASP